LGSLTLSAWSIGSSGHDELDLTGAATVASPLADSNRKALQAWFFGWLRAGVQHDERLLANLEAIVEKKSRASLAIPSLDRSMDMLRMQEELASLDDVRRQDLATAWVQVLSGKGDI
jgi:hypothetical protein